MKTIRVSKYISLRILRETLRTTGAVDIVCKATGAVYVSPDEIDPLIVALRQAGKMIPMKKRKAAVK